MSAGDGERHGTLDIDGRPTTFRVDGEAPGRPRFVCAHGAGAPLTSDFMELVTAGLVERGLTVVRFHFPYMHQMVLSGKRRPPERAPVLLATWRAVLARVVTELEDETLCVAGKSLGGRMASLLLAEDADNPASPVARVDAAVYLGFPLHPAGKAGVERAAHLPRVRVPQLFVSGDRDALADPALLTSVFDASSGAVPGPVAGELLRVEGGDHSLAVRGGVGWAGADSWLDAIAAFVARVGRA